MKKVFVIILSSIFLCSCGGSSGGSDYSSSSYGSDEGSAESDGGEGMEEDSRSVTQMVACPMCGGSGVFEYMPGDVMAPRTACSGCNGSGAVTPEVANEIVSTMSQSGMMQNGGGGKSAAQLELELKKAYETLEGMEYDREMCTSVTLRPQYDRMIIEQKQYIERLEAQYYNSSY